MSRTQVLFPKSALCCAAPQDTIGELGEERTLGKEVGSVYPKCRGAGIEETHKEPRRIPGIHQNQIY